MGRSTQACFVKSCYNCTTMSDLNTTIFFWFNSVAGRSPLTDQIIIIFANYLAYFLIIAFVILVFLLKISRTEKIKFALSAFLAGIINRVILVESIRYFYHHPRPFIALTEARQLFPETGYSFPSGHATFFFGLSAVVYYYNKKAGVVFFILSLLMGAARIIAGVHYPFDIIGGICIGSLVGFGISIFVNHVSPKATDSEMHVSA